MLNYVFATVLIGALGACFHFAYRWWVAHLTDLAQNHALDIRRRLAALHFVPLLLALGAVLLATLYGVLRFYPVNHLFLVVAVALAIVPNLVWWFRRWPSLRALGYGRQ